MSTSAAQLAPELSSRKRRKVSGLTSFELSMMYEYIQKIRSGVADLPDDDDDLQHDLERVLEKVQAKLNTPKHTPFSSVNTELLNYLQITPAGELSLRNDSSRRVEQSKLLGADKFMSSTTMHSLLQLLEDHTIQSTEASARLWIDVFMYRATAMVDKSKHLFLNLEYTVLNENMSATESSRHTLGGTLDYLALLVGQDEIENYRYPRGMPHLKNSGPGFFIVKAKVHSSLLMDHMPQAVAEMITCAKYLTRTHLRGALTNGQLWIFVIVTNKPECPGGSYYFSQAIRLERNKAVIDEESANKISGILADWIERSFDDIGEDDWFILKRYNEKN